MATLLDLNDDMDWDGLEDGEVRVVPLLRRDAGEPHGARITDGAVSINVDYV